MTNIGATDNDLIRENDHEHDWRYRMRDEYWTLRDRADRLEDLIDRYVSGELDFTPTCPVSLLRAQLEVMRSYQDILRYRFQLEGISMNEERC